MREGVDGEGWLLTLLEKELNVMNKAQYLYVQTSFRGCD